MSKDSKGSTGQPNYIEGLDISHYQGDINWAKLIPSRSGKQFIIAKATEGVTYQDPKFVQNIRSARAAGFERLGAYHFLRFGSDSPSEQMANFVAQIDAAGLLTDKEAIIALDIEEYQGEVYTLVESVTEESVRYLKNINITPYIYTSTSFWDAYVTDTPDIVKECPLWIARYRENPPLPDELPAGWDSWKIWQYSSQGSVPGITGNVDLNKMIIS